MVHFPGTEYRAHSSCMSEEQKYQGSLYKPKRQKSNGVESYDRTEAMAHNAYVEDVTEEYEDYRRYEVHDGEDGHIGTMPPPEAPTPPPAASDDPNLNVFDFLDTPTVSNVNLQFFDNPAPPSGGRQLVRFEQATEDYVDSTGYMVDDGAMVHYGTGSVPANALETPAPKLQRRKTKDSDGKKTKKRKQLHIETPGPLALEAVHGDEIMTDAPPVLHSGLTGGLNRMMRPSQFPPSPDYSGGDGAEKSPTAPIRKTKHKSHKSKSSRTDTISGGLRAFISGTSKSKVSKKRKHSSDKDKNEKKSKNHHRSSSDKAPKLIEYKTKSGDEKDGESGQMILYRPRSDLFLSLCSKGPESERGCSVNKALKRFHRERSESGTSLGKSVEEKELWRSLRMRRNEQGEIVLFSVEV
ncbi:putative lyar-type c2hc zinc finger protein [Daldinia childiae]|uniref:putative lyar-type c2hc zinc finger protein n=1 Tax=Daldinia childiae TaxID=326645 RepID=UPI001445113A|nr:putative lyar-type c2hc zinc finger protein [Daldinia childiae]KAF3055584.1 putative lyar-type c2hc zinc finger protein [Daldinia childiae]